MPTPPCWTSCSRGRQARRAREQLADLQAIGRAGRPGRRGRTAAPSRRRRATTCWRCWRSSTRRSSTCSSCCRSRSRCGPATTPPARARASTATGPPHVSIGRNVTPVPGMPDRQFRGMSSHYVHTLREGDRMNVFLDRAEGFHLQEDVTAPMIFVSAGTGLRADARLPVGAAGDQARRASRSARRRCSTASAPATLDYIYARRDRGVRSARACSSTCTSPCRARCPAAATTSRTRSSSRARSCGSCSARRVRLRLRFARHARRGPRGLRAGRCSSTAGWVPAGRRPACRSWRPPGRYRTDVWG